MENEKTLDELAAILWSRLAEAGFTYPGRWFRWPDGRRLVAYRELGPLAAQYTQDLTGPEWSYARSHFYGKSRVYRLQWALRYAELDTRLR